MTTFTRDSDGIPHCQVLIDGQPCNGFLYLTQDGHYLACEKLHSKLIPVNSNQAMVIRQVYRNRDTPSKPTLNRRWKDTLPVAVRAGTVYRTNDTGIRKQIAIYQVAGTLCEVVSPADQDAKTIGQQSIACIMNRSGQRSAKLFTPANLTIEQVARLQKKIKGDPK